MRYSALYETSAGNGGIIKIKRMTMSDEPSKKETTAEKTQRTIEKKVRKSVIKANYNPLWMTKS